MAGKIYSRVLHVWNVQTCKISCEKKSPEKKFAKTFFLFSLS